MSAPDLGAGVGEFACGSVEIAVLHEQTLKEVSMKAFELSPLMKPRIVNKGLIFYRKGRKLLVSQAMRRLIEEGKLMDAHAVSDRLLQNRASDQLLQLLIERGEENLLSRQSHVIQAIKIGAIAGSTVCA